MNTAVKIPHNAVIYVNSETESGAFSTETNAGSLVCYTRKRPEKTSANEDSLGFIPLAGKDCVLAVADGMGGMPCGDQASRITIEKLQLLKNYSTSETGYRDGILDCIDTAQEEILRLGVGAGTTLAMLEIFNGNLRPYHVGDSMIMVVGQRGKIKFQSIPHSPVGYAVESGMLDESEALHHHDRHIISNFLGDPEMRIEIGPTVRLAQYDTVLVASDGLFDNLFIDEIIQIIRKGRLGKAGDKLAGLALERMLGKDSAHPSKPDDVSFILYRRGS